MVLGIHSEALFESVPWLFVVCLCFLTLLLQEKGRKKNLLRFYRILSTKRAVYTYVYMIKKKQTTNQTQNPND